MQVTSCPGQAFHPDSRSDDRVADLLERVAAGDGVAFQCLFETASSNVYRLARTIVRDNGHAEEVTQEVFLQLWQRAGNYDRNRGAGLAWVTTITRGRSVDRIRATQAARIRDTADAQGSREPGQDIVIDHILRADERLRMRAQLSRLSAVQQQAIELVYYYGHTNLEASTIIGVPLATFKSRIRDGLVALRKAHPTSPVASNTR